MQDQELLAASPLGKTNVYTDQYDASLLFAICRDGNRVNIGIDVKSLPFKGVDIWNGFDFTWLDAHGQPHFGVLKILVPCDSPNLIESKSLKLYLFSFANTKFENISKIIHLMQQDLSQAAGKPVTVSLEDQLTSFANTNASMHGVLLDTLEVLCSDKDINSKLLNSDKTNIVTEQLCSDLLKSNCLVTGKPDWGSVRISYTGPKIDQASLLQYIVSYRNHQGFHEQCIEHIYFDILKLCNPSKLIVEGRYTRRGGLDINPIRANLDLTYENLRLFRQ